jgi:predicted HAD superfamily Cof-like phosphohydrolase
MLAVGEFHTAFGLPLHVMPQDRVDPTLAALRVDLLEEEVAEFRQASQEGDVVAIADALGDIAYVLYGTALTYGINLDAVIAEVHRSNMSKLDTDGKPILRGDGKVLKPATYSPPELRRVLGSQVPLPFQPLNEGRSRQ